MASPSVQMQLSEPELKLLQTLVYQECGMHFDARRTHFLQDRLQRRLKECHIDSFYSYYRLLISHEGKEELTKLLENLTVNETSFFRNKAQLDLFHKHILDQMLRSKQERRDFSLRLWSAGCSTGQEAYTMAMLVADALSYHCLRSAETTDPGTLESGNSGQRHQLLSAAGRTGRHVQRAPDVFRGLQLPAATFRQSRRSLRGEEVAEGTGPFRLPQLEDGVSATAL
jgi:hypothetical protein